MQLGEVALAVPTIDHLMLFCRHIENENFYCSPVNIFRFLDRILFLARDHYTKIKSSQKFKIRKCKLSKISLPTVILHTPRLFTWLFHC